MTPAEVSEGLGLDTLKNRQWSIFKSCAIKGEGLEEGLDWWVPPLCAIGRRLAGELTHTLVLQARNSAAEQLRRLDPLTSPSPVFFHPCGLGLSARSLLPSDAREDHPLYQSVARPQGETGCPRRHLPPRAHHPLLLLFLLIIYPPPRGVPSRQPHYFCNRSSPATVLREPYI